MAEPKKRRRKRRIRSPHPGVVWLERKLPSGGTSWRARFTDPDTGKLVYLGMRRLKVTNHEGRREWAMEWLQKIDPNFELKLSDPSDSDEVKAANEARNQANIDAFTRRWNQN